MFVLRTTAPSPCPGPEADTRFGCLADSHGFPCDPADPRLRPLPEGTGRPGWTWHLGRFPGFGADSPLFAFHPRVQCEPGLRWPWTLSCSDSAAPR